MFGALIATVTVAHYRFRLNAVLAFWVAYILTRPLGASLGDYLSPVPHRRWTGPSGTFLAISISRAFSLVRA